VHPVQVTHEGGGAFMADAVSRLSDSVGVLTVVPASGLTHAASGIGEAFLDGIPMIVISGGPRTDMDYRYQLHQMDTHKFMGGLTKATFHVTRHDQVVPVLFEAYTIATSGEPGPVFVELPANILLMNERSASCRATSRRARRRSRRMPNLHRRWRCCARRRTLACSSAGAPATRRRRWCGSPNGWRRRWRPRCRGLSCFPGNHPLHAGFGFGASAVPAAQNAFKGCDCMMAIGTRFSEIPTGSYGVKVPENLIHIDINPQVFGVNYPAKVAIAGDAGAVLDKLLARLEAEAPRRNWQRAARAESSATRTPTARPGTPTTRPTRSTPRASSTVCGARWRTTASSSSTTATTPSSPPS